MTVTYNSGRYQIEFTDFENEVLLDIYSGEAAIVSGLSKILNGWTLDRLRHYDERRGVKLYEGFKALSTDAQNQILGIIGQNGSNG